MPNSLSAECRLVLEFPIHGLFGNDEHLEPAESVVLELVDPLRKWTSIASGQTHREWLFTLSKAACSFRSDSGNFQRELPVGKDDSNFRSDQWSERLNRKISQVHAADSEAIVPFGEVRK